MVRTELDDDIRRFILTSIPSVPYLEAVLLVRSAPETAWEAASLSQRLYLPVSRTAELLEALRQGGVVQPAGAAGQFRYAPTAELAHRIDALAGVYAANLLAVTDLIHSRIDKRAQQFADAFRFRKDS